MANDNFGLPSSGGSAPKSAGGTYTPGWFQVPNAVQRSFEWDLYSSCRFAAAASLSGAGTIRLFAYARGATGPGYAAISTISETNMLVGALAPGGESYAASAIAIEIFGDAGTAPLIDDVRSIMRLGVVYWEFGQTLTLPVAPISMIGAGGGIFGFSADTGTPVTAANNGNGGLWMYQNVVVVIPATQSFALQLQFGSGGQAAAIAVTAATQVRANLFNGANVAVPVA